MGCQQSKAVRVKPVGDVELKQDNTKSDENAEYEIDEKTGKKVRKNRKGPKKSRRHMGSVESLDDGRSLNGSDRGFSATSKMSKQSADSGLGGDDGGLDNPNIITEYSDVDLVRRVENGFQEKDVDLGVTGKACPQRTSAKDRSRMEERAIMDALRGEGLISSETTKATGGISFEVVAINRPKLDPIVRPPPQLAKLEKKKKKKKVLTEAQIQEKLARAEARRKKKEQERLEKIKEIMEKHDTVNSTLESYAQNVKEMESQQTQKMDHAEEMRERKRLELKEKNRRREEHARRVRERKQLQAMENINNESMEYSTGENVHLADDTL